MVETNLVLRLRMSELENDAMRAALEKCKPILQLLSFSDMAPRDDKVEETLRDVVEALRPIWVCAYCGERDCDGRSNHG